MDSKERDYYFDNAKFILILFVVAGHAIELLYPRVLLNTIYRVIYLFHMPAFVFISGYFSKLRKRQRDFNGLFQYCIFQATYWVFIKYVLKYDGYRTKLFGNPHWVLWFFLALFVWDLLIPCFNNIKWNIAIPASILIAVFIGIDTSVSYHLALSRIICFFPFFLLGYYFKKENIELIKKMHWSIGISSFLLLFKLVYRLGDSIQFTYLYNSDSYHAWGIGNAKGMAIRLGYILCAFYFLIMFLSLVPQKRYIFSIWGTRTLQVCYLHGFILMYFIKIDLGKYITVGFIPLYFILILLMVILLSSSIIEKLLYPILYTDKFIKSLVSKRNLKKGR